MKSSTIYTILCFGFAGTAFSANAQTQNSNTDSSAVVTLIGLGSDGKEIVKTIPASAYSESISAVVNSVQASVAPALESQDATSSAQTPKWSLRTIAVGCTITSQIGLGPIWSISPSARLRLIFSNSTSPVYPD